MSLVERDQPVQTFPASGPISRSQTAFAWAVDCTASEDGHGPSIAVHPAFVAASLAAPHETERQRGPLKLARRRARHARFQSCPSEEPARGPDAPGRSKQTRAQARPMPPHACPSARSTLREPGFRRPTSHRLGGKGLPCNRQSPWGHYMARGRPTCRTQSDAVRPQGAGAEHSRADSCHEELNNL
jgi:hypothetical protein